MVCGHATGFRATKLGEHGAHANVVYLCWIKIRKLVDGGFEDLPTR